MNLHPFDFDAAVGAPFRMQPGLRRLPAGASPLTPSGPGTRHLREKLAVLRSTPWQALLQREGFDPGPALDALAAVAAADHPGHWATSPEGDHARRLGVRLAPDGRIDAPSDSPFSTTAEVAACLDALPPAWRRAALLSLAFAEDLAVVDGSDTTIPWLAVALPSHWAPEHKVGRPFAEVHRPVADNALLLKASEALTRMVCGPERWERFVWTVTDHPRLHAHPDRVPPDRWTGTPVHAAWFRCERQAFVPVPGRAQAVFTIHVQVQPLAGVAADPARARALHAALATMSEAVLDYRGLAPVREPLLAWLSRQAGASATG